MNVFAKFDEIPSMILQDIKETKRYGHKNVSDTKRTDTRSDNVKTVYPPTNTVCGGYKNFIVLFLIVQVPGHCLLSTFITTKIIILYWFHIFVLSFTE